MTTPKSITGKFQGSTYRRVKSTFKNNEEAALKSVLKKHPKERVKNLEAVHTEKMFVWKGKTKFD